MRFDSERLHYIELFISCIFVILNAGTSLLFFFISNGIAYFSILFESFFLLFVMFYVLRKEPKIRKKRKWYHDTLHLIFIASTVSYIALFIAGGTLSLGLLIRIIINFETFALFFMIFLPIFFLAFIGVYLMKSNKMERKEMLLIFLAVFCVLMLEVSMVTSTPQAAKSSDAVMVPVTLSNLPRTSPTT
ncbi:MAG: hypothetical protein ABSD68_03900 [Candidatus Micrarchaeales archaeon]